MKIKTQFYLFIAGIILIPFLLFGAMALLDYNRKPERLVIPSYSEITKIPNIELDSSDWEKMENMLGNMGQNFQILLFDKNFVVLFSTMKEFVPRTTLNETLIIDFILKTGHQYFYQMDIPSQNSHKDLFLLTRVPRDFREKPERMIDFFSVTIYVLGVMILFCCVMIYIIAHSFTKSITTLEKATSEIAKGNLDLEVVSFGSNEISSLVKSLNTMRENLKDAGLRRQRFIMGVSHDLRTPIALIKGYTEAISDGMASDPVMLEKSLDVISSRIVQLEDMVDDLINFVKLDSGEWRQRLEKQNIVPVLEKFGKRLQSDGSLMGRKIIFKIQLPETILLPFDEQLLVRALDNLCGNAFRYTQEEDTILLSCLQKNTTLEIAVSDTGLGIAKEDIPFIFDTFYRGSNSRREEGTGLGLAVVQSIVQSHGWRITVESQLDKGSTFTIAIPLGN